MFYVWQMNDGRWHISAYTSSPRSAHALAFSTPGYGTKAEADAARQDLALRWATMDVPAFRSELTSAGEQLVIPGCERQATATTRQLGLWD